MEQTFPLAEKFKAPQGEGLYAGTPMAFVRLVGCTVGKKICTHCDTDFETMIPRLGGGKFNISEIMDWAKPYKHLCLTGGEPLNRRLGDLILTANRYGMQCHVETSGTVLPPWIINAPPIQPGAGVHLVYPGDLPFPEQHNRDKWQDAKLWICVSPKPGWHPEMIRRADEVKVIIGGLGDGEGWPTLQNALEWADQGKLVFVQPRNFRSTVDRDNLNEVLQIIDKYPQLRLSAQMHKMWETR